MAYDPTTDVPFDTTTTPADTLLVSDIPKQFRDIKVRINEVAAGLYSASRVLGVISIWGTATPPANHIECDGQSLTSAEMANVRAIYGNNAPDYRGWFLRGWAHGKSTGNGSETDFNRAINSQQNWMIGAHDHTYAKYRESSDGGNAHHVGQGSNEIGPNVNTQTSSQGGLDNRPSNIAVMYIMRYK